jgi:hypothetical protein
MAPTRMVNLEAARARFGDRIDRLGAYLLRVDPLADAAIDAIDGMPAGAGWGLVRRALEHGIASVPEAPAAVRTLLHEVERVPVWVDWDAVDRGGAVLLRAGALGGIVLGVKSLVMGYASPGGNKPLVFSGRLESQVGRRLAETTRFVQSTITPGGMRPHAAGWRITVNVRLIHAQVRRMILRSGRWDAGAWGAPINQHDQLGTSLLFSVIVLEGLRQLGVRIPAADAEAYMHLWRWSSWLMGVDPELVPATEGEAHTLGEVIAAMQGPPDDDSRNLTRALLEAPLHAATDARARANAQRLHRFSATLCRALVGAETADALGVPRTPWRHALPIAKRLVSGMELFRERVPYANRPALWAGTRYWDRAVQAGFTAAITEFALPQSLARAA